MIKFSLHWISLCLFFTIGLSITRCADAAQESDSKSERPNILWIIVEDMSADFACYGQKFIKTPNVDQLAASGIQFTRAFVTAPICSISRSALITGRYQTSIGAQNHRSSVPGHPISLPNNVQLVPRLMREAGYHTNNLTLDAFLRSKADAEKSPATTVAKTDYNFEWNEAETYDNTHWDTRPNGKPFFVQIQLNGGKYRGHGIAKQWPETVERVLGSRTQPDPSQLPPYLAPAPEVLEDWAQYLDTVRYTDWELGRILERLKASDELKRTVIFFMTDHGVSHIRNKQFLYDGGTHVPLIVSGPGIQPGQIRKDLVEHIDLGASSLGIAGVPKPAGMHSQDILSKDYKPRDYVYAARDRADETVDLIRSVRDTRWKYIFNGFPNRPYLQPNNYKDNKPIVQAMRRLYAEEKLNQDQSLILADTRPAEELYDTSSDPFEMHNLAADPQHQSELKRLRNELRAWQVRTMDPAEPESEEVYRLEVESKHAEAGKNTEDKQYQDNVQLMLRWMREKPLVGAK